MIWAHKRHATQVTLKTTSGSCQPISHHSDYHNYWWRTKNSHIPCDIVKYPSLQLCMCFIQLKTIFVQSFQRATLKRLLITKNNFNSTHLSRIEFEFPSQCRIIFLFSTYGRASLTSGDANTIRVTICIWKQKEHFAVAVVSTASIQSPPPNKSHSK